MRAISANGTSQWSNSQSIRVETPCGITPKTVVLYSNKQYEGDCQKFREDYGILGEELGIFESIAPRSVKVGETVSMVACSRVNGSCTLWLTQDVADLSNQLPNSGGLSVMSIEPRGERPTPPVIGSISNPNKSGNYIVSWSSSGEYPTYVLQERYESNAWSTVFEGGQSSKGINDKDSGKWCYRVLANDVGGSSEWSNVECTTVDIQPPAAPVLDPIDNADSDGSFTLNWNLVNNASAYRIYEGLDGSDLTEYRTTFSNWYEVTDKAPGKWCYRVTALADSLESPLSNQKCATVTDAGDTEAPTVNWIDPVGNSEVHKVGGETVKLKVSATDDVAIEHIEFRRWDHPTQQDILLFEDTSAPYETTLDTSDFTNDWNEVYVLAFDAAGNVAKEYIWLYYEPAQSGKPAPPQNLSASDGTLIAVVTLTWTESEGATYYEVYRSDPGQSNWELFKTENQQTGYTNDGLNTDGTVLSYAVKACSNSGCSVYSNSDTGYADMPVLNDIDNEGNDDSYIVSWGPANTAGRHELEERHDSSDWSNIYKGDETSLSLSDKAPGEWCYRLRAYNGIQLYSPWTPIKCANVAEPPGPDLPEIDIRWEDNGVSIHDGDYSPSTQDGTDFGSMDVSGGSVSHIFRVYNTGDADLTLDDVILTGCDGFTVTIQPDSLVASNSWTVFVIKFDPQFDGTCNSTITISNGDSDENPYNFRLTGMGEQTDIVLDYHLYLPSDCRQVISLRLQLRKTQEQNSLIKR
ncbi:MAG: choice-of-anchor D domain-containing protein [Chloroflexota bacterium]